MFVAHILGVLRPTLVVLNCNQVAPVVKLQDLDIVVMVCECGLVVGVFNGHAATSHSTVILIDPNHSLGQAGEIGVLQFVAVNVLSGGQQIVAAICKSADFVIRIRDGCEVGTGIAEGNIRDFFRIGLVLLDLADITDSAQKVICIGKIVFSAHAVCDCGNQLAGRIQIGDRNTALRRLIVFQFV